MQKLPAPREEDLSKGNPRRYRHGQLSLEKKAAMSVALTDEEAEIQPVPTEGGGGRAEPELARLSDILKAFNEQFGTLFGDGDRVVARWASGGMPRHHL